MQGEIVIIEGQAYITEYKKIDVEAAQRRINELVEHIAYLNSLIADDQKMIDSLSSQLEAVNTNMAAAKLTPVKEGGTDVQPVESAE